MGPCRSPHLPGKSAAIADDRLNRTMCIHITPELTQLWFALCFMSAQTVLSLNVQLCLKRRYLAQVLLKQSSAVPQPHNFCPCSGHRHASRSHEVEDKKIIACVKPEICCKEHCPRLVWMYNPSALPYIKELTLYDGTMATSHTYHREILVQLTLVNSNLHVPHNRCAASRARMLSKPPD